MSILEYYLNKNIGILNVDSAIGKVLLRKLATTLSYTFDRIYVIGSHNKNTRKTQNNKNSDKLYEELFEEDRYLRNVSSSVMKSKVKFVSICDFVQEKVQQKIDIDVLFNCHLPQDFTKNNIDKCLDSHIYKSKQYSKFINQNFNVNKLILVSSIYSQNYGYVAESDGQINTQPLGYNPQQLTSSSKLKQNLSDIFSNDYEIWQWSVLYMQSIFTVESGAKITEVVRLPLVGPTLQKFQGYTSGFNTLTSLIYEIGKKQIDAMQGNLNNIIDVIPADFVSNYLIVIAALWLEEQQNQKKSKILMSKQNQKQEFIRQEQKKYRIVVHNLSTSSRNPIPLSKFAAHLNEALVEYTPDYIKPVNLKIYEKKWQRKAYKIQSQLPNQAKARLAHLFDVKSWKIQTQQQSIHNNKKIETMKKYRYFFQHQWICESNKSIDYFFALSQEEQLKFNFNVNSINWKTYTKLCCYSINKYLLNLQVQHFNPANLDLLNLQKSTYFSDIYWALTEGKQIQTQNVHQIKNYILSTKSVKQAIRQLVEQQTTKLQQTPTAYERVEQQFYKVADEMCMQMFSQYSMNSIRGFAWFLHKLFRVIYEKVVVDKNAIMKIKSRDDKVSGPLVIIPTHRSYIDFLIVNYVFFGYGIKVPHIAAAQDFLNMAIVHILLRKSGAFFIKRDQKKYRNLYKAIMTEYISKLLVEQHYLQFFIEGTRSRVGKMLEPKFGMLSIVCKNVLDGKIPDAQIIPVTINFQKILEGTSYTYEMMGETKVKESLSRLIKAADVVKQNYGRIYLEICEPISVQYFFNKNSQKYKENQYERCLNDLGYKIVYTLSENLVIFSAAIVASIILMDRIGISDDRLSQKAQWLSKQITSRGIKVARTQSDSSISISSTLTLMGDVVNKSKKDMFEVQVSFDQDSFVQLFTLTYYRNTLTHIFFEQALIAVALSSFGHQEMCNCKVPLQILKESTMFLSQILRKQYILPEYMFQNKQRFAEVLQFMVNRDIIQMKGEQTQNNMTKILIGTKNSDSNIFMFYCSLIWPVIESYWICVLYLFKLIKQKTSMQMSKLQSEIQWFGQSIFTQRIILHLEAISMDTIKNATATLKSMKIIQQSKGVERKIVKVLVDESTLKALQRKIQLFLKSKYAASFKGSLGSGRGAMTVDFPFLSKL